MSRSPRALIVLLAVVGLGAPAAWMSVRSANEELAGSSLCDVAGEGRWEDAARLGAQLGGEGLAPAVGARCHCIALVNAGRPQECVERALVELRRNAEWVPDDESAIVLLDQLAVQHRAADAAAVVDRIPPSADARVLLPAIHTVRTDPHRLERLARRVADLPCCGDAHAQLGLAALALERADIALQLVPAQVPPSSPEAATIWADLRSNALAVAGDEAGAMQVMDAWERAGASTGAVAARRARLIGRYRFDHTRFDEYIDVALARRKDVDDPGLVRFLYFAKLQQLLHANDTAAMAALIAEAKAWDPEFKPSAELGRQLAGDGAAGGPATLRFEPPPGMHVLVSPDPAGPADAPFEELTAAAEVKRTISPWPVRWVLVREDGARCGSGLLWPVAGGAAKPHLAPGPCIPPRPAAVVQRAPADGRRRIVVVMLDSMDWRVVRYAFARGEAPFLEHLATVGASGVLVNEPAFTIVALQKLVEPGRQQRVSTFGIVNELGEQLALFEQIGGHPFPVIQSLIPTPPTFFDALAARGLKVANLLSSHGRLGRTLHGELVGPKDERAALPLLRARAPSAEELAAEPGLGAPKAASWLFSMLGIYDDIDRTVADPTVDVVLARVDGTDVAFHSTYGALTDPAAGHDDNLVLVSLRYADRRLAGLAGRLDEDDVLLVISDHGARSSLEHDESCLLLGLGVRPTRLLGTPAFDGLPRALARLRGLELEGWPDTGIALEPAGAGPGRE